jgi:hypothetical protein
MSEQQGPGRVLAATFFAGVFARDGSSFVPDNTSLTLRALLSRRRGDTVHTSLRGPVAVFSVNTGVLAPTAGVEDPTGCISIVAGEPLTSADGLAEDLSWLHEQWRAGDFAATARALGTFCGVHVDARGEQLWLVTDRVGLRPIYYASDRRFVYFATALRVLEDFATLPKTMDLQSLVAQSLLAHTLGDRTRYANIKVLLSGEVIEFAHQSERRQRYWRLEDVAPASHSYDQQVDEIHRTLRAAVARRAHDDRCGACFLSGGLDSRTIVTELRDLGCRPVTFNFAREGTLDRALGDAFAAAAGTSHVSRAMPPGPTNWSQLMADAIAALPTDLARELDRPGTAWSGDGGSVGVGHVLSGTPFIDFMRAGKTAEAARAYMREQRARIPSRLFSTDLVRRLDGDLFDEIVAGLSEVRCEDPGRSFWTWRMLNDQRRHLFRHFEDLDLHRLELLLPFYDGDLISAVAAAPVDRCAGHQLYADLLTRFPALMRSVPWQAYPGAVPCPIPVPPDLSWQWADSETREPTRHRVAVIADVARATARSRTFPLGILQGWQVALAAVLHLAGIRDYRAELELAGAIARAWGLSEGRVALPGNR